MQNTPDAIPDDQPEQPFANADIDWQEGDLPYSSRFDDIYFSRQGGLAETEHVFLAANPGPDAAGIHHRRAGLRYRTELPLHLAGLARYPSRDPCLDRSAPALHRLRKISDAPRCPAACAAWVGRAGALQRAADRGLSRSL